MEVGEVGHHVVDEARAVGLSLHGVVDGGDLVPEPAGDGGVVFLERAEAGVDDFAGGGVGARGHELVDEGGVLLRQADGAFLEPDHDTRSAAFVTTQEYDTFTSPVQNRPGPKVGGGTGELSFPALPGPARCRHCKN